MRNVARLCPPVAAVFAFVFAHERVGHEPRSIWDRTWVGPSPANIGRPASWAWRLVGVSGDAQRLLILTWCVSIGLGSDRNGELPASAASHAVRDLQQRPINIDPIRRDPFHRIKIARSVTAIAVKPEALAAVQQVPQRARIP